MPIIVPTNGKGPNILFDTCMWKEKETPFVLWKKISSNKREKLDVIFCYRCPAPLLRKLINIWVWFKKHLQHFRKLTKLQENISSTLEYWKTCHKFIPKQKFPCVEMLLIWLPSTRCKIYGYLKDIL